MEIKKIVITGGPCAGKSTAMKWIQNAFTQKGYTVLFVPETATEFITGGVAPWTGHPHLRIIDNSNIFENKMKKLISEIALFLGEFEA